MPTQRQILDAIFNMARIGLTEIAKDNRNGPAVVANNASVLEHWRVACLNQLLSDESAGPPVEPESDGKV